MWNKMKIQSIKTVYFSATGNTKNVVKLIGETIARNMNLSYKEIDFTLPQAHKDSYEFTKEELVIFGTPVYAGRVPNKVLPMIQGLFQGMMHLQYQLLHLGTETMTMH